MKIKTQEGFNLVELLIAVFVIAVGILGTLLFFTSAMRSTDYAHDLTIATTHMEYVLEEMQTRASRANIAQTNWASWSENEGLSTLTEEEIAVTISNASENPLETQTTVSWKTGSRDHSLTFTTNITKP